MFNIKDIVSKLPEMMSGKTLEEEMMILPEYDCSIRNKSQTERLMALSSIYGVYIPSSMSYEIYSKLYVALIRSLQKKCSTVAIQQRNENFKAIKEQSFHGIIGGADSGTIIGVSGVGKSSAIGRAVSLITENRIIELEKPYLKIIPIITVQCPFDCSTKGLLLEILRKTDEIIGTNYYSHALKIKATADTLVGTASNVCINNVGVLIIDEIQNVIHNKSGRSLVGMLTQLINNSGISMFFVGTPECIPFFEQAIYLARRALGLQYGAMEFDSEFINMCEKIFQYQYVRNKAEMTDEILYWLYEHSGGLISVVVALLHAAQELAILNSTETLDIKTLNDAYKERLSMLHGFIEPSIFHGKQTSATKRKKKEVFEKIPGQTTVACSGENIIAGLVLQAKNEKQEIVALLKEYCTVVEVTV